MESQPELSPFLDNSLDIEVKLGTYLPHWNQDGKTQFITFRLADSLPKEKISELENVKKSFKAIHPEPWSREIMRLYENLTGPIESRLLDNGYGDCLLRRPEVRKILSDILFFKDGKEYDIIAFVIMPNHIHLLIWLMPGIDLDNVMQSIKGYSAFAINKALGRKGRVWMKESFDRIVRSGPHLGHCINYIQQNPKFLPPDKYDLYLRHLPPDIFKNNSEQGADA